MTWIKAPILNSRVQIVVHGLRHLCISSLERAGVKPKMAQTLARHSDIRLTLGVDTHVELHDQTAAIEALPPPPNVKGSRDDDGEVELGLVG